MSLVDSNNADLNTTDLVGSSPVLISAWFSQLIMFRCITTSGSSGTRVIIQLPGSPPVKVPSLWLIHDAIFSSGICALARGSSHSSVAPSALAPLELMCSSDLVLLSDFAVAKLLVVATELAELTSESTEKPESENVSP